MREGKGKIKGTGLNLQVVSPYGKNHLKSDVLPLRTKGGTVAMPQAPHLLFYCKPYLKKLNNTSNNSVLDSLKDVSIKAALSALVSTASAFFRRLLATSGTRCGTSAWPRWKGTGMVPKGALCQRALTSGCIAIWFRGQCKSWQGNGNLSGEHLQQVGLALFWSERVERVLCASTCHNGDDV